MRPLLNLSFLLLFGFFSLQSSLGQAEIPGPSGPSVRLSVTGSKAYATAVDVPVKPALLFTDTVNFYGKSGVVKLAKGQTTLYLVLSNMEAKCETVDTYDRKAFLQMNAPSLVPKLPKPVADEDFVALFLVQLNFDPRKVQHPPLMGALDGHLYWKDLEQVIPGAWHPKPKDFGAELTPPESIRFVGGIFTMEHPSSGDRKSRVYHKDYHTGTWAYGVCLNEQETLAKPSLFLDITRKDMLCERAMVTLTRTAAGFVAGIDVPAKGFTINGNVPISVCPASVTSKE